jgi:RNA polymerase sigma-70 factor (family 1)
MTNNHHDDLELVLRFQAGDMLAFDTIYKKYSGRIFYFAFNLLKNKEDAENIVQEVFIKFWENRENIRLHNSFSSYIFAITHNTSIDLIRKKLKDSKFKDHLFSIQERFENPIQANLEFNESQKHVLEVIDKLTKRQRQVYLMHHEEGFTYHEIADKLDISVNTVENHMAAALRILREKLKISSMIVILYYYLFL